MSFDLKDELGQVWTPQHIVENILDEINYTSQNIEIIHQKIIEPSFGNGVFIYEILQRLITALQQNHASSIEIEKIIDDNVYAIEYDQETYEKTLLSIKEWLLKTYNLNPKFTNFFNMDSLDYRRSNYFDYVVGNPPYIRIHDMPQTMREKVKEYSYSHGNSDLYVIFLEIGLNMLNNNGVLGYITPNSWLRNTSQKRFRTNVLSKKQLRKIVNFNSDQVFDKVGTYTCLSFFSKNENKAITYVDSDKNLKINYTRNIDYDKNDFSFDNTLAFSSDEQQIFLNNALYKNSSSLGEVCKIQNGVLTLGNKYFLVDEEYEAYSDLGIENLFYPSVKSTTYKGEDIEQKIVFPYQRVGSKFVGLSEDEFKEYPEAYEFLLKNKEFLMKRSLEKDSLWFWYRSQSLQETDKEKLVFSHVIGPNQTTIKTYKVPENTIVYGGFFITENTVLDLFSESLSLNDIQKIIESSDFINYLKIVGKDKNGGYKEFSTSNMKKFRI